MEPLEFRTLLAAGMLKEGYASGPVPLSGVNADYAQAVAAQPDGKFVVAGRTQGAIDFGIAVARYNADGSLDESFGQDGKVVVTLDGPGYVGDIALQADGKIVIAGGTGLDFAVFRLTSNGYLDPTFDGDGRALTDFAGQTDDAFALAIRPDGRIVVAGTTFNRAAGTDQDFALAQYFADGSLDPAFGVGGKAVLTASRTRDEVAQISLQGDGKILVAGATGGADFWAVARVTADGRFDTTFGKGGVAAASIPGDAAAIQSLKGGGVLVVGTGDDVFEATRFDADGQLDPTFGVGGRARVDFGFANQTVANFQIQKGGKIVLVGSVGTFGLGQQVAFAAARLNTDGGLDRSFGRRGRASFELGLRRAADAALLTRGKILIVGGNSVATASVPPPSFDFRVSRLTAKGAPDASFGAGGSIDTGFESPQQGNAVAVAPLADGGSLVLSAQTDADQERFALSRHQFNGLLDPDFGDGGVVYVDFPGERSVPGGLAVSPSGRIAVVGTDAGFLAPADMAVAMFEADGTPVVSFGNGGQIVNVFDQGAGSFAAIRFQGEKLLAAGGTYGGAFLLVRLNPDGALDPTFGDAGITTTTFAPDNAFVARTTAAYDFAVQADGKIVVVGTDGKYTDFGIPPENVFAIARYTPDGQLDPTFGAGGKVMVSIGAQRINDVATSVAIQEDGRIVVAGTSASIPGLLTTPTGAMAVIRLRADGALDTSFGGDDGKVTVDFGPYVDSAADVLLQPDGKILLAGHTQTDAPESGPANVDFALARLTPAGDLDPTFGVGGKSTSDFGTNDDEIAGIAPAPNGDILVAGRAGNSLAWARYSNDPGEGIRFEIVGDELVITGTPGDDRILLGRELLLGLVIRGVDELPDGPFSFIRILGGGGNDLIDASTLSEEVPGFWPQLPIPLLLDGGFGDDLLIGGPGDDTLFGGGGDDTLRAAGGNDYLNGGPGRDRLFGDSGNDQVFAVDGLIDAIDGGAGFDRVKGDADEVLTGVDGVLA